MTMILSTAPSTQETADFDAPPEGPPAPTAPAHVDLLADALLLHRGPVDTWRIAPSRAGVAAAVIDAVMSPRVTSMTVEAVLLRFSGRYGADAGVSVLMESFATLGDERWRCEVGTHHRAFARLDAPYKSQCILAAAQVLAERGIERPGELLRQADDDLRDAWIAVPGQSSGFTWRHLLLAAGQTTPLVCPLTRRFLRRIIGREAAGWPDERILALFDTTAHQLGVNALDVDHQVWRAAVTPRRSDEIMEERDAVDDGAHDVAPEGSRPREREQRG